MTWSRFDDGYDEHDKIDDAWFAFPPNPVGLHVQATTACNRWLSDGVIKPRWITYKLPDTKQRGQVLGAMLEHGLFDLLVAGERRVLVDSDSNEITVGQFDDDRYIVHDFLDRHDSSVQTKARRALDAERKRLARAKDSERPPAGRPTDSVPHSTGSPPTGGSAGAPPRPDPTLPLKGEEERTRVSSATHPAIVQAVAILRHDAPFLPVEDLAVDTMLKRGERAGLDAVDLAGATAALAREYEAAGTLRARGASTLMLALVERRERSNAAGLAEAGATARAAVEGRVPRGRPSAEERAAARDRKAAELRIVEQRGAA